MIGFRKLYGAVYVLENPEAERVKVGMTINKVVDRLRDVNAMWLGRKGTCQVCGGRLVIIRERVPQLVGRSRKCPGSHAPPLERESSLAEKHLLRMKNRLGELSGAELGSFTKMITTLERRVALPRHATHAVGSWRLGATFFTECAEEVELLSHTYLAEHLDEAAPIGEVFRCSVPDAIDAVWRVLDQLGLAQSARMELRA